MKRKKNHKDKKYDKFFKQIGLKIRAVREELELTLEDVEHKGYPSWKHLQKIESGEPMTLKTLYNVSSALGVHPSELLEGVKV